MSDSLEQQLQELTTRFHSLPAPRAPPPTTLEVLGRSGFEQDWQRYLFHFLSAERSHGLDTDLLSHLLTALSETDAMEFDFSLLDLQNFKIAPNGRGVLFDLPYSPKKSSSQ